MRRDIPSLSHEQHRGSHDIAADREEGGNQRIVDMPAGAARAEQREACAGDQQVRDSEQDRQVVEARDPPIRKRGFVRCFRCAKAEPQGLPHGDPCLLLTDLLDRPCEPRSTHSGGFSRAAPRTESFLLQGALTRRLRKKVTRLLFKPRREENQVPTGIVRRYRN